MTPSLKLRSVLDSKTDWPYFRPVGALLLSSRNQKENMSYYKIETTFFLYPCDPATAGSAEDLGRVYLLVSVFSVSNP